MNKYALTDSTKIIEGQLQRILDILTHKLDKESKFFFLIIVVFIDFRAQTDK
jgi:hypothetical protein